MNAQLQLAIDQANQRAGKSRQKVFAKKGFLIRTDKQVMELVAQRFREYERDPDDGVERFKSLRAAVELLEQRLQGKS
jgi:hypothetical protein